LFVREDGQRASSGSESIDVVILRSQRLTRAANASRETHWNAAAASGAPDATLALRARGDSRAPAVGTHMGACRCLPEARQESTDSRHERERADPRAASRRERAAPGRAAPRRGRRAPASAGQIGTDLLGRLACAL